MAPIGLGNVGLDILIRIFELVDDSSPRSMLSLAAVSQSFRDTAKVVSYRHQTVTYDWRDSRKAERALLSWLPDKQALRNIRHIKVQLRGVQQPWGRRDEDALKSCWATLVDVIKSLANLKTLSWSCDEVMPFAVIQAVDKCHPKAEIKHYYWHPHKKASADEEKTASDLLLAKSQTLAVLRAKVFAWKDMRSNIRHHALPHIIANAPNLQRVEIAIVPWCYSHYDRDGFLTAKTRSLPKLEPSRSVTSLILYGFPLSELDLEEWSRLVDFSSLEKLEWSLNGFNEGEPFSDVALRRFINLKHIKLDFTSIKSTSLSTAMHGFLATCSPLMSLGLLAWDGVVRLSTILDYHGSTLETLCMREKENESPNAPNVPRRTLSATEVNEISQHCPRLRELTIDLNRSTSELDVNDHIDILNLLANMKLNKLHLYYDLGVPHLHYLENQLCDDLDQDLDELAMSSPFIAVSQTNHIRTYIKHVWAIVFGWMRVGDRALDVSFGEYGTEIVVGNEPAYWMIDGGGASFWQVRPEERDDHHDKCWAKEISSWPFD